MRVAFWNINTGKSSYNERINTLVAWCQEMTPDVLILEEVSYTLVATLPALTGMIEITHAATLDKNFQPSTKQISITRGRHSRRSIPRRT